jgi:hypothetical protein
MGILEDLPLWVIFIGTVLIVLLATEVGYHLGLWLYARYPSMGRSSMTGPLIGGMMGLLAFLLALTFAAAVGQHADRKGMVVTEANAIGTAYLRAGFLEEPDKEKSRGLLSEYVEVRLAPQSDPALFDSAVARSEEIHAQLWSIVEENVRQEKKSDIMALYAEAINTVIDVHTLRLTAAERRLPSGLLAVLYLALVFSFLLLGVASSDDGKRIPPLTLFLFAMVFVTTMILILDLNRPLSGLVTVSQEALEDLLRSLTP